MATIIYARKSSESEDRQVQSLEDQIQALQAFAQRENIIVSEVITEARSAKSPYSRPEFQRIVEDIQSGKVDGILTWSINRLSRNLIDGGLIAHMLQTGQLRYIRTPERTYRPEDNVLIMSIENGMATSFVQDLSRNVKRGMQGKVDRGGYPGSAPIGYKNNLGTHEIEPDPQSFPIIEQAWKLLLSGQYSVAEIHRELVSLGLKGMFKANRDRPVSKSVVHSLFRNRFYTGQFSYKGEIQQGNHQAMITVADYNRAQAILSKAQVTRPKHLSFSFSGSLKCGTCGCAIVGESKRKHYKGTGNSACYTYYHCTGAKGCVRTSISESALFEEVASIHNQLKIDSEFVEWCRTSLRHSAEHDASTRAKSVEDLKAELGKIRARAETITTMRIDGELTSDEFLAVKEKLKAQEVLVQKDIDRNQMAGTALDELILAKLDSAVALRSPESLTTNVLKGHIRSVGENHTLTLGKLSLSIDPIIQKIATFEPRAIGSERAKADDYFGKNPGWLACLDEARTFVREFHWSNDRKKDEDKYHHQSDS